MTSRPRTPWTDPEVTSRNSSTGLAHRVVEGLLAQLPAAELPFPPISHSRNPPPLWSDQR